MKAIFRFGWFADLCSVVQRVVVADFWPCWVIWRSVFVTCFSYGIWVLLRVFGASWARCSGGLWWSERTQVIWVSLVVVRSWSGERKADGLWVKVWSLSFETQCFHSQVSCARYRVRRRTVLDGIFTFDLELELFWKNKKLIG